MNLSWKLRKMEIIAILGKNFLARLSFWMWGKSKEGNSLYIDNVKVKMIDIKSY